MSSKFDLETYISNYSGYTKIKRLLFIATKSPELKKEAIKLALTEIQKGINTQTYKEVFENFKDVLEGQKPDEEWIAKVDNEAQKKQEKLELELNSYRTNLIRESIRMGHNDLGDFFFQRGDLQNALKSYLRTRDYCTTPKHVVQMAENVIKVSIATGNYALVTQYVSKAESTLGSKDDEKDKDPVVASKLRIASGLAFLESKKYKQAARKFIECNIALGDSFSEVFSCQDVGTFGALCALISFDRKELKQKCIDHVGFKNFLELVPNVRELLTTFYESKYSSCLQYLDKIIPEISLDIYLHEHADTLYKKIRSKALIQYVSPFTSVDMKRMAQTFNTNVNDLEKELATLIADKQIKARIDSHNKVLYARVTDQRDITFQKVTDLGQKYLVETEKHILRMNMLKHRDFVVKPVRKQHNIMM